MSRYKRIWVLAPLVIILLIVVAFAATPGSDQDPLVTMSYVEKRWQSLQLSFSGELDTIKKSIASIEQGLTSNNGNTETPVVTLPPAATSSESSKIFEANTFEEGTQILLGKGSELIVRRGQSVVIDPTGNAVPDLTDGIDLMEGTIVPLNHVLLCPKEDGRGIRAMGTITVMIKGKFQLLPPIKE